MNKRVSGALSRASWHGRLAVLLPWLSLFCWGCAERGRSEPTPAEATLSEQSEAVRSGRSNTIRLDRTLVGDDDLKLLDGLDDKLLRVNLSRTTISDTGLAALCQFPRLEQLRLASSHISDAGLACLTGLKHLRHLHLIDAPLSDQGLDQLHALSSLDSLYLDGTRASDAGIARLVEALPRVHLHFDGGHHRQDRHMLDHRHEARP